MYDREGTARKVDRGRERPGCPVTRAADGTWRVHDHAVARALLRGPGTVQAGLGVETVEKLPRRIRRPVLYRDGPEHREHRRQTARFFTPRRVDEHYRDLMVRIAEEQLASLRATGEARLADLAFELAVGVVSEVIGLRYGRPGIAHWSLPARRTPRGRSAPASGASPWPPGTCSPTPVCSTTTDRRTSPGVWPSSRRSCAWNPWSGGCAGAR
ncbi:hypothetical protein [Streptomyces cyaneogriseus]|uniref:hypothetical protein n=1 Tax=Streptomyces cyaneogriseus TaxID=68192 RepID=UPI000A5C4DAA